MKRVLEPFGVNQDIETPEQVGLALIAKQSNR